MKDNIFMLGYLYSWITACVIALGLLIFDARSHAILSKRYRRFLLKPWKLATFILAALGMTLVAPYSGDPTWDYFDAAVMSVLTYISAPWVVGVLYQRRKKQTSLKQVFVAVCLWMFSASWSYDLYILIQTGAYPRTWLPNIVLSSILYYCAGLLWNLDWTEQKGVFYAFKDADWPNAERRAPFRKIFPYTLPYVIIVAALCGAVIYLCSF